MSGYSKKKNYLGFFSNLFVKFFLFFLSFFFLKILFFALREVLWLEEIVIYDKVLPSRRTVSMGESEMGMQCYCFLGFMMQSNVLITERVCVHTWAACLHGRPDGSQIPLISRYVAVSEPIFYDLYFDFIIVWDET